MTKFYKKILVLLIIFCFCAISTKVKAVNYTKPINNDQLLSEFEYPVFFEPGSFHKIPLGYFSNELDSIHPVNTAYYALYNFEEWRKRGYSENIYKEEFRSAAKAIRDHLKYFYNNDGDEIAILFYDFDWDYAGELIQAPWVSGMAQGMAISILLREYSITQDKKYFETLKLLLTP